MTIYNIEDYAKEESDSTKAKGNSTDSIRERIESFATRKNKPKWFSNITTRLFFILLLIADILWMAISLLQFTVKLILNCCTLFRVDRFQTSLKRSWLSIKRSIVCLIATLVAIINPPLGVMFACLYFLMYDKRGMEEIVPQSMRDQFKDFFPLG